MRDFERLLVGRKPPRSPSKLATVLLQEGDGTYPIDGLDVRNLPEGFDFGRGFVELDGDPWRASRRVEELATRATGVVLHAAGELVVPIEDFVAMLGDLDDPECRPFTAWLDLGLREHEGTLFYGTFGMNAFGLPDVVSPIVPHDPFLRSRRHEAVLFACHRMVRAGARLRVKSSLLVPVRSRVGAWPLEPPRGSAAFTYEVTERDDVLVLVPINEPDLTRGWPDSIELNAYQAIFESGLRRTIESDLVDELAAASPELPPHSIEVRDRHDGHGFLVLTNGFGRIARFEVAAWVPAQTSTVARFVSWLAAEGVAAPVRWKPSDMIAAPIPDLGIAGFVLADGGAVVNTPGREGVQLLLLVPLDAAAYASARGGNAAAYLAQHPVGPTTWTPFLKRLAGD